MTAYPRRGRLFGSAAELYEQYRPDYPAETVEVVLAHARRPVRTALEIGAGTGKATRLFGARGIDVTAVEPDAEMTEVLVVTTAGMPVRTVASTLEDLDAADRFDLVYAAAAWHWIDPALRWTRAVELLAPGGVLALFGRPCDPRNPDLRAAIEEIEKELLPTTPAGHPWSLDDVAGTAGLCDAVQIELPAAATITATRFVGMLSTVSAYLTLEPPARSAALARVQAALPAQFEVDVTVHLCLARRVP